MSISQNKYSKHSFFMKLALMQAHNNLGNTNENPSVGCTIVKNSCLVGAGFTSINGRPHAEQNAINFCKNNISNSYLYVTLEPCSNYGKTPPCVNAIIKNKIKKVFFSLKDPDIKSFDKSFKKLRKNNIPVKQGILKSEIKEFYRSYHIYKKKEKLPFVTGKIAISKDYLTVNKKAKWITNNFSRGRVHLMRNDHDCIITSANTVIKDNPRLNCRIPGLKYNLSSRVILDKNLDIPFSSNIVKFARNYYTIIFFNKINKKKIKLLNHLKIKMIRMPLNNKGNFNLKKILEKVKIIGFSRILLECGNNLTYDFLKNGLINDFKLFISSKKLGKNGTGSFKKNIKLLLKKGKPKIEKVNLMGDKLISYKIK